MSNLLSSNDPNSSVSSQIAELSNVDPYNILGSTGLKRSGGYVSEEWHRLLQGRNGARVFREMRDNSSAIGPAWLVIQSLIRQTDWRVDASDEKLSGAQEQAEFVESCLDDMSHSFDDLLSEILTMMEHGWAYHELVYKLRKGKTNDPRTRSKYKDGKVGWRKISLRGQDTLDRWEFQPDGGIAGLWQFDGYTGINCFIPIEKALLFRTQSTLNNPEGRSLLRNAFVDYHFLKRIQEIEAIGIERDMTGLLTMEVPLALLQAKPGTADAALLDDLKTMMAQLKQDERMFAVVPTELDRANNPTGYKFKLLTTGGKRQMDTTAVKNYYRSNILQCFLTQFLQLGQAGSAGGSRALSSDQVDMVGLSIDALMDSIEEVFNRFAIPRLMRANQVDDPDIYPKLCHGKVNKQSLEELGKYLVSMATAGLLRPDEKLAAQLRELGGLTAPEENPDDIYQQRADASLAAQDPQDDTKEEKPGEEGSAETKEEAK